MNSADVGDQEMPQFVITLLFYPFPQIAVFLASQAIVVYFAVRLRDFAHIVHFLKTVIRDSTSPIIKFF